MSRLEYQGKVFSAAPGETLLDALLRQGADITHSCRKGSCGCCQLRLLDGSVDTLREVDASLTQGSHVLCCVSVPRGDVKLARPDPNQRLQQVELLARTQLAKDTYALDLAPLRMLEFRGGQHVYLIRGDNLARPYSIASRPEDDFSFRIHVRRRGEMSTWLCEQARIGERMYLRGPHGGCHDRDDLRGRPLLMLATGVGAGALMAVARDALAQGHAAPIEFHHGVGDAGDLYLDAELRTLAQQHPNFHYRPCVSGERTPGAAHGRIVTHALENRPRLEEHALLLCGLPAMVEDARVAAILADIPRERILADPFEFTHSPRPRDAEKVAGMPADPELWAALEQGPGLTRLLEAFYARAYEDPRLSPFFHNVTRDWAVQKQYEFLSNLFNGNKAYFGLNPYNAHHWMVISDELFDYREALFESVLREAGLAPDLIRRWLALHEQFRTEMVKGAPRGMIIGGVEQPLHNLSVQRLEIDAVCDGCHGEIAAGAPSRYQYRVGSLHCAECAGITDA
ncbi:2Fe-2S iron-sulfur cluster-binding protein [Aerolutibacter ruishenii]|uniref:NAD(P)H-flavin reductase n=1 Tax=Aerolutibacter ruishenii TaxID=686800 RepID=A0A562LWF9_9GAMM|nr:2Fe-2S iron-sulfur cluster-binding protein [Lysobacter ruishenii]TWI11975.1 NAD(P)H-flavin reductase [Lysobacter ruishenii]